MCEKNAELNAYSLRHCGADSGYISQVKGEHMASLQYAGIWKEEYRQKIMITTSLRLNSWLPLYPYILIWGSATESVGLI